MRYLNSTRNFKAVLLTATLFTAPMTMAQTNVFDAVIVPSTSHNYLEAALIATNLQVALQNDMASLTVFAPTDAAFDDLAAALNTDIAGLLALPNLDDILLYHVLGTTVNSGAITNGNIVQPLSMSNTIKLTATASAVYANHAMVTAADLNADNGTVHVIDNVLLPTETVVDVAIDQGFSSLAAAVIAAELLPALTNPLSKFTVFAPTNQAFDNLATALGTDIAGLLALPVLDQILLYHVVSGEVLSTDLTSGTVATLNGESILVDLSSGVMINDATVTLADVTTGNGVVHVIDRVLDPNTASLATLTPLNVNIYPNPSTDLVTIEMENLESVSVIDMQGNVVIESTNATINVSQLAAGNYVVRAFAQGLSSSTLLEVLAK